MGPTVEEPFGDSGAGRRGTIYDPLVLAPSTFAQRLDARVADAIDRRLVDRAASGSRVSLGRAAGYALATPVHLVSLALVGGAVVVLVRGEGVWAWLLAAFLLLLAWVTRPRFSVRANPDTIKVDPARAPELVALVDEVCRLAGAKPPAEIRFDHDFNAYVAPLGLHQRHLVLGAPLWAALGPQERVALLGHEVGHLAHGDVLSSQYVGGAHDTLLAWVELLHPEEWDSLVAHVVFAPPRWLVRGYLNLFVLANATSRRRQELYADLTGVLAAGTEAAVSDHEVSLLADAVDVVANRAAMDPARPDIAEAITARMAAYDANQRAAARRAGAEDRRRTDASHPPTVDRLRLVESVEPSAAAVVLTAERSERIDRELAPVLEQAFKRVGDLYRYVH